MACLPIPPWEQNARQIYYPIILHTNIFCEDFTSRIVPLLIFAIMKYVYVTLFLFAFTLTQSQDKLTPETLWKIGRVSDPKLSPDKKTVIYGVKNYDLAANKGTNILYSLNLQNNKNKALTDASLNASAAKYTPDGKRIGFLSAKSGDMQLWEIDPNGNNLRQVTNIEGGINGFLYSPDATKVLFFKDVKLDNTITELYPDLPNVKAKIIDGLMYRHWDSWEDESYSHVFYVKYNEGMILGAPVDAMKDQRFDAPLQPMGGEEQLCWAPNSKSFIYTSKKLTGTDAAYSTNSDLFNYNIETGVTTNLTDGMPGYDQDPQYNNTGKKLFWLSMERPGYESDKSRLMCYDFDLKQKTEISADIDRTFESFTQSNDGKYIYAIIVDEGCKQILKINISNKKIEARSKGIQDYLSIEIIDNNLLLTSKQTISKPTELYITSLKAEEITLTHTNDKLYTTLKVGTVEKRMVKATDGKDILCWVTYPPDFDKTKKYPTLLFCQGGPQSPVSQFFSYRWNFQLMAAKGYIVIAPNRRGLQGFGKEWNDQIGGDYGGQCMNDLLSSIDDISKEKYVDKDRLGCVGASFGGYSAYWIAGHHEKRFKAFIAHCGMFNMESWYGTTEEMFFAKNDQKGSYWDNKTNYDKFSPHHFVKSWDTPILIIHNEKDYRVPLGQGMEAFTAAQSLNVPSRFLYFPDENHWVTKPQNSVLWQRVFFDWLDKHLK